MSQPENQSTATKPTYEELVVLLRRLKIQAWMRQDYKVADEIADAIGDQRPTDHERDDS